MELECEPLDAEGQSEVRVRLGFMLEEWRPSARLRLSCEGSALVFELEEGEEQRRELVPLEEGDELREKALLIGFDLLAGGDGDFEVASSPSEVPKQSRRRALTRWDEHYLPGASENPPPPPLSPALARYAFDTNLRLAIWGGSAVGSLNFDLGFYRELNRTWALGASFGMGPGLEDTAGVQLFDVQATLALEMRPYDSWILRAGPLLSILLVRRDSSVPENESRWTGGGFGYLGFLVGTSRFALCLGVGAELRADARDLDVGQIAVPNGNVSFLLGGRLWGVDEHVGK